MFGNPYPQYGGNYQQFGQGMGQQMMQAPPVQMPQMQYPAQQTYQPEPVTLQSVVDMMGQILQELSAIREGMRRE